jgi:hypothetical protein
MTARSDVESQRGVICELTSEIEAGVSRVQHLVESEPLSEADGKVHRLTRVIPLFRSENARARGMDPRSIKAFTAATPEIIPPADLRTPFHAPDSLPAFVGKYEELRASFASLEREREAATEVAA